MDSDEKSIYLYLKGWPGVFVSRREIARRAAGKRRYRQDPDWASAVLARMIEKGILDSDATGHYRLKTAPARAKPKIWVSPQIQKILEQGGKVFEIEEETEQQS